MVDERTTPEDELEAEPIDTPEGEQVETPEPEERPDQPAPGVIAQAEYTRATQLNAAIRKELGLAKGASQSEILAALQARGAPTEGDDEAEEEELDPRIAAAQQRAYEAELRVQRAVYGEEFADKAIELLNVARTTDDLEELFGMLSLFVEQNAPQAASGAAPAEDADEQGPAGNIDMSEGERATATESNPPSSRRESGVVSALRGLFADAGAASRPPR
jgi:hypothetical protein